MDPKELGEGQDRSTAPLALDAAAFRAAGHALVDRVAAFLEGVPDGPVTRGPSPDTVRAALRADGRLPERGGDAEALLDEAASLLFEHSLLNGHPRFFGYITSSPAHIGILADMLAAAVNPNVGAWILSPMASEMEAQAVRWIGELTGYPAGGGLLVSGGNMANIVGLFAARAAALGDVRERGVRLESSPRVYASGETHTWIQKGADLAGLGTDAVRWVPTDGAQRMDAAALGRMIEEDRAAGATPVMAIGTAGTVSTGAVDPLDDIASVCEAHDVWFHVDGAYGAFAAAAPDATGDVASELAGMARADSLAVDPHKWLYAPLEAGCTLVRDPATLRAAFAYHPPYYHFGTEATNFVDLGPQNSRGFRALKVWLALRHAGREGYARMIGDDIRLAARLFDTVRRERELEAVSRGLSIVTFRYVPERLAGAGEPGSGEGEDHLNRLNEALLERIQASGEAFVSNAVVDGRYLLRACIVNFNTRVADVDALPGIVVRMGREVDGAMR